MFPTYIAKRIYKSFKGADKISSLAVNISVSGIALGITIIILSLSIITGFKHEIRSKIYGFSSDIRITSLDYSTSFETNPIYVSDSIIQELQNINGIISVQKYSTKPGMIKTSEDFQGIILKGIDEKYDTQYLKSSLIKGEIPNYSNNSENLNIIISQKLSNKLQLDVNDYIYTYYLNNNLKARKLHISGIYNTNINEYDDLLIICDIRLVNKLNDWDSSLVSGLEIRTANKYDTDSIIENIYNSSFFKQNYDDINIQTPEDLYPDIFSWLDVLDMNVIVILILMFGLAIFSIISGLLIIILEKVNMIGILKALGAQNKSIKNIFLNISLYIIGKGLIWGNIIGLLLFYIQYRFHIFKLDPNIYYISYVPMRLNISDLCILNISTIIVSILILTIPSMIVSNVSPTKTIKFD